jgi:hypothetical protein
MANLFNALIGELSAATGSTKTGNFQTVDTGVDATKVGLYATSVESLKQIANLPNSTTKKAIIAMSSKANTLKARNFKLASLGQHQLSVARELSRGITIQQQVAGGIMSVNENLEKATAQFGIRVAEYQLNKEVIETGYTSYLKEMDGETSQTSANLNSW